MATKAGHRRFGSVRRRRSGRWQARYQGPDGLTRSAPMMFDSKRSAEQWLTLMEDRILPGEWQPPEQSKIMFGGYATHWVADRRLEPRSRDCTPCCCGCTSCLGSATWRWIALRPRWCACGAPIFCFRAFGINRGEVLPPTASDLEHGGEG